jgi:hypothetical protein
MRIPLRRGRMFTQQEWADSGVAGRVAVINEYMAQRFWKNPEDAIGKRFTFGSATDTAPRWVTIVGVAADSKYWTLGETIQPAVYRPMRQEPANGNVLHVRTRDFASATAAIRAELQALAPTATVEIKPMTDAVAVAVMPSRIGALFTAGFGIIAMLLAAMGIYAVVSFSVASRTKEIGVRRAIGATTGHLIQLVAVRTAILVALGLAIGLTAGTLGAQALGGFIIGVRATDPLTLALVALVILVSATLASLHPTWRATRVDPLAALRAE